MDSPYTMPQLKIKKKNIVTIQFCLARYPDELVRVYPQMQQTNPNGHKFVYMKLNDWIALTANSRIHCILLCFGCNKRIAKLHAVGEWRDAGNHTQSDEKIKNESIMHSRT